jgi:hypothetical protein
MCYETLSDIYENFGQQRLAAQYDIQAAAIRQGHASHDVPHTTPLVDNGGELS